MSNILVPDTPSDNNSQTGENAAAWLTSNLSNGWESPPRQQNPRRSPATQGAPGIAPLLADISNEEEKGDLTPFSDRPSPALTLDDKEDAEDVQILGTPRSSPPAMPTAPSRASRTSTRSNVLVTQEADSPSDRALARRLSKNNEALSGNKLPALVTTPRVPRNDKQAAKKAISDARKRKRMEADVGGGQENNDDPDEERVVGSGTTAGSGQR